MPPIRWSNRVRKPKVHWEPPPPTRRQRQPAFTIHADPSEDQPTPEDLGTQSPEDLGMESEDLGMKFKDLGMESEDLDMKSEHLDMQFPEDLDTQPAEDQSYQPQFLSKDKTDKSQNLSEDSNSLKLFQLFFSVKEIENIVKQINQWAIYINFKHFWKSLTVTEIYHYLECLVYMRIQSLWEFNDHWQLKIPVVNCFTERHFNQIQCAFIIQDSNTSLKQSEDSW